MGRVDFYIHRAIFWERGTPQRCRIGRRDTPHQGPGAAPRGTVERVYIFAENQKTRFFTRKREKNIMEKWKVFRNKDTGRELCAYTIRGTFPGEEANTIEILAHEEGIAPDQITVTIENRKPQTRHA